MRSGSRILLVLETSGGGSGRHVIDLAREYSRLGHRVHVAYSGLRMEPWFYEELCALESVQHVRIDMRRSPHPSDVRALWSLRRYLSQAGPFDVIHGHSSKGGALARLATLGCGGLRVYTPHALRSLDPLLNPAKRRFYATLEYALCAMTDGIIHVSEEERTHALGLGFPPAKLFVVANGLSVRQEATARGTARARLGLAPGTFCIGFVGRLVAQKAPERVVEALAVFSRTFPNARLVMLGDGPLAPQLRILAEHRGVLQQIIWLPHGNGFKFMPAFDVFVMPSLYEAFPYVLIEAAAAGLPIIATPVGGTQALVLSKKNGFIVPHDQPGALAAALAMLLDTPDLRRRMGNASRAIAATFTVETMATATLEIYRQLSGRRKRR